jgi:hypothetical protein
VANTYADLEHDKDIIARALPAIEQDAKQGVVPRLKAEYQRRVQAFRTVMAEAVALSESMVQLHELAIEGFPGPLSETYDSAFGAAAGLPSVRWPTRGESLKEQFDLWWGEASGALAARNQRLLAQVNASQEACLEDMRQRQANAWWRRQAVA